MLAVRCTRCLQGVCWADRDPRPETKPLERQRFHPLERVVVHLGREGARKCWAAFRVRLVR